MSDDFLKQYTSALRDEYDGASVTPEVTRARVIRSLAERKPRRAKWWAIGIPTLALLGGSTAWAAASGQLSHFVQKASIAIGIELDDKAEPAPQAAKPRLAKSKLPAPAPIEEPVEVPSLNQEETTTLNPTLSEAPRIEAQPALKAPAGPSPEELAKRNLLEEQARAIATYKKGHDAHYARGNCAQAIDAYSDYLRLYPSGSFTLEARYNRAVCLIQVGQLEQAKSDLRPFAQGVHGNYRKEQAQSLLDALGKATGSTEGL